MVDFLKIEKTSVANYDFTSNIPMSFKGFRLERDRLSKARFIYPLSIPFMLTISKDTYIFKFNNKYEENLKYLPVDDTIRNVLERLKNDYVNIIFRSVLFDKDMIPIAGVSEHNVVFGIYPDDYFDKGKFLIPSHISRVVADTNTDKNQYGLLKLGHFSVFAFNYYNLSILIVPYMMSFLLAKYGEPVPTNLTMSLDSFKLIYTMLCAEINYDRAIDSIIESYYNLLKESDSLPTVNSFMGKDTARYLPLSLEALNLKSGLNKATQLALADNTCSADNDGVESFFVWDVGDLFDIFEYGYIQSGQVCDYTMYPIADFVDILGGDNEVLEGLDSEIVVLTPQSFLVGDMERSYINKDDILTGFYVEGRFIIIFKDDIVSRSYYSRLCTMLSEDKKLDVFESVEMYTLSEIKAIQDIHKKTGDL